RLRGLACRDVADVRGTALHFPRTKSVHTFGMRFALDLVWLDKAGEVVRVDLAVPPRRHRANRAAAGVVECVAGESDQCAHLDPFGLR
ncbi:MAG TPA: DUF192 domain-containing protein, partial [Baekduia sp.]|nr:DUF192 domain-containing protein [Baekduia sp.]